MSAKANNANGPRNVDVERVEALGGHVRGQPNNMPWGQRVAHIDDPDGNAINLTQPI